jgi:hypothetical protein
MYEISPVLQIEWKLGGQLSGASPGTLSQKPNNQEEILESQGQG